MLAEVRKCADNHDIKGLRYIFVDALDVDPTFDTYREDYEYCKTIPGMFDEHVNISPVVSDKSRWTTEYWEQLKLDLMKNFSEKRFEHMRLVAQVVYADKVSRLMTDRKKAVSASIPESVSKQPEIKMATNLLENGVSVDLVAKSAPTLTYDFIAELSKKILRPSSI